MAARGGVVLQRDTSRQLLQLERARACVCGLWWVKWEWEWSGSVWMGHFVRGGWGILCERWCRADRYSSCCGEEWSEEAGLQRRAPIAPPHKYHLNSVVVVEGSAPLSLRRTHPATRQARLPRRHTRTYVDAATQALHHWL
jgi:hypothetical protein